MHRSAGDPHPHGRRRPHRRDRGRRSTARRPRASPCRWASRTRTSPSWPTRSATSWAATPARTDPSRPSRPPPRSASRRASPATCWRAWRSAGPPGPRRVPSPHRRRPRAGCLAHRVLRRRGRCAASDAAASPSCATRSSRCRRRGTPPSCRGGSGSPRRGHAPSCAASTGATTSSSSWPAPPCPRAPGCARCCRPAVDDVHDGMLDELDRRRRCRLVGRVRAGRRRRDRLPGPHGPSTRCCAGRRAVLDDDPAAARGHRPPSTPGGRCSSATWPTGSGAGRSGGPARLRRRSRRDAVATGVVRGGDQRRLERPARPHRRPPAAAGDPPWSARPPAALRAPRRAPVGGPCCPPCAADPTVGGHRDRPGAARPARHRHAGHRGLRADRRRLRRACTGCSRRSRMSGRCRRTYAIEGLGAVAVRPPHAPSTGCGPRRAPSTLATVLAATDPANAYGAALPWPALAVDVSHRPGRKAGAVVVMVDGELVLYLERGGKSLLMWDHGPRGTGRGGRGPRARRTADGHGPGRHRQGQRRRTQRRARPPARRGRLPDDAARACARRGT